VKNLPLILAVVVLAGIASAQTTLNNAGGYWCSTYACSTTLKLTNYNGYLTIGPFSTEISYSYTDQNGVFHDQTCRKTGGSSTNYGLTLIYDFQCPDGTTGVTIENQYIVGYVSCGGRAHLRCPVYEDAGGTTTLN